MEPDIDKVDALPARQIQTNIPISATFARNLFPRNFVFSDQDLIKFCQLIESINEEAIDFEINAMVPRSDSSIEEQRQNIRYNMSVEYNVHLPSSDSIQGLHPSRTLASRLPSKIESVFLSNTSFSKRIVNDSARNKIDIFLDFSAPSTRLDVANIASNETPNRSVINIIGTNESWVLASEKRVQDFFRTHRSFQIPVHGAGFYDYFLWFAFLPVSLWVFFSKQEFFAKLFQDTPVFLVFISALYCFLVALFFAQVLFKVARRIFPPTEYYQGSWWRAGINKGTFLVIIVGLVTSAMYDILKFLIF